jgi:hypothetical protein
LSTKKKCGNCGQAKEVSQFNKRKASADGLQPFCKECDRAISSAHYQQNRERYYQRNEARLKNIRDLIWQIKEESKCVLCGETHPACLVFHHRDAEEKEFAISEATTNRYSLKKIVREIKKCDLICANCHAKIHYKFRKEVGDGGYSSNG